MESKWRLAVWENGWANELPPYQMFARLVTPIFVSTHVGSQHYNGAWDYWLFRSDGSNPVGLRTLWIYRSPLHFPGPFIVE